MEASFMADGHVTVVGSGTWGTTLAILASRAGNQATLYVRQPEAADEMRQTRLNGRHLPGVEIPVQVEITSDLTVALSHATLVILAVPSQTMRANAAAIRPYVAEMVIASAAKGLERDSLLRMSQVLAEELPSSRICAISGPNLAREIAARKPATTVIASIDP